MLQKMPSVALRWTNLVPCNCRRDVHSQGSTTSSLLADTADKSCRLAALYLRPLLLCRCQQHAPQLRCWSPDSKR